jgi:membrane protein involved in colicin uptake
VQRAAQIDELTVTPAGQGAGGAGAASAGSAAGPAGSTGAGSEGTDYEELAEQVYDKIRARLVAELLLDRERAGMLVDW